MARRTSSTPNPPLTKDDVCAIALALPETELSTSWGDVPTLKASGKGFVMFRHPRQDCLDESGKPMEDVIVVRVPTREDHDALIAAGPWFTIDHFRSRPQYVLVRERDLDQIGREELTEVLTDARATVAPRRVVRAVRG